MTIDAALVAEWQQWVGRTEERTETISGESLRRFAAALGESLDVEHAPPSLALPPRAFQYLSATGRNLRSSRDRLSRVESTACFSEQIRPIWTSPSCRANTCGLSMEVSVMPISCL